MFFFRGQTSQQFLI
uniref:Uncharacterized protein n=1 Tax=Anguilla anguilla TaxID=7936 RepID=A0A0E9QTE4_ANGAN